LAAIGRGAQWVPHRWVENGGRWRMERGHWDHRRESADRARFEGGAAMPAPLFCMIRDSLSGLPAGRVAQISSLSHDARTDRRTSPATLLKVALRRPKGSGLLHWLHSFSLHVITGFAAVAAHYALMYLLIRTGLAPVPASAIGFLAGALTRFVLSYAHIFAPTRGVHAAGLRFVVAIAAQLAANSALLAALTHQGLAVWPAQVLTTILLTVVNYLVYRWWVFR
jgi:putative flippase GtrA